MFNFIKTRVAGLTKNRFQEHGFNLDLTYITPRIIAMSFPASSSTFQAVYRNNAVDVTNCLLAKHGEKFHIFNLSE